MKNVTKADDCCTETKTIRLPIVIPSGMITVSLAFTDDWILGEVYTHPDEIKRLKLEDDEIRLYNRLIANHIEFLKPFARKNRLRFLTQTAFDDDCFIMEDSYVITDAELIYSE